MIQNLKESLTTEEIDILGYDRVIKVSDALSGLVGIICLHDLSLGPALGGIRIHPYPSFEAALNDVMRLAKGMTYKSALAETGYGGGKAVIIADPKKNKTEEKLKQFAEVINQLKGTYIAAEDVGCSIEDVDIMSRVTPYVVGLTHHKSSGDPGPFTAWGVFRAIQSVLKHLYGDEKVQGRTIAIQGVGNVGQPLMEQLFWQGAKLIISDINREKVEALARRYGAQVCLPEEIMKVPCDVFAPCAMGGILNTDTIPQLRCRAIAGSANNQLLRDSDADELMQLGILYAPDFIANAGGLINVAQELDSLGYSSSTARDKIHSLYDQLLLIYSIAAENNISTHAAAVSLGDYRLKYKIGKRTIAPCFHHANRFLM